MKPSTLKRAGFAAISVLCVAIGIWFTLPLEPSEFGGGRITGSVLSLHELSTWLFLMAAGLTFYAPRAAAGIGLCVVAAALPLYAFCVAPGLFRALFRTAAIVALMVAVYEQVRMLSRRGRTAVVIVNDR
jgi:hypothetical protein